MLAHRKWKPFTVFLVLLVCILLITIYTNSGDINLENAFFLKHCAASVYLNRTEWLYVLDADTAVINFDRCLEDFVDARFDVIHQERFHNGEISAGNYIVRNSHFSRDYLTDWADLEAPFAGGNRNVDNGALHYHILGYMDRNQSLVDQCRDMFRTLKSFDQYFNFVACVKRLMNGQRLFKEIKILRRGLGFVRDSWVTDHYFADSDFMLHAVKPPDNVHFTAKIDVDKCAEPDWTLPVRPELKVDAATMTRLIRAADARALKQRPNILLNVADVSDCWPKCPENISYNR